MQMVDTIVAITETDIATEFVVQGDNIFVKSSVLEEAGLIENMAQTCSAVVGQFYFSESNPTPNVIVPFVVRPALVARKDLVRHINCPGTGLGNSVGLINDCLCFGIHIYATFQCES